MSHLLLRQDSSSTHSYAQTRDSRVDSIYDKYLYDPKDLESSDPRRRELARKASFRKLQGREIDAREANGQTPLPPQQQKNTLQPIDNTSNGRQHDAKHNDPRASRDSGAWGLGLGMLGGNSSDSDSDSDDEPPRKPAPKSSRALTPNNDQANQATSSEALQRQDSWTDRAVAVGYRPSDNASQNPPSLKLMGLKSAKNGGNIYPPSASKSHHVQDRNNDRTASVSDYGDLDSRHGSTIGFAGKPGRPSLDSAMPSSVSPEFGPVKPALPPASNHLNSNGRPVSPRTALTKQLGLSSPDPIPNVPGNQANSYFGDESMRNNGNQHPSPRTDPFSDRQADSRPQPPSGFPGGPPMGNGPSMQMHPPPPQQHQQQRVAPGGPSGRIPPPSNMMVPRGPSPSGDPVPRPPPPAQLSPSSGPIRIPSPGLPGGPASMLPRNPPPSYPGGPNARGPSPGPPGSVSRGPSPGPPGSVSRGPSPIGPPSDLPPGGGLKAGPRPPRPGFGPSFSDAPGPQKRQSIFRRSMAFLTGGGPSSQADNSGSKRQSIFRRSMAILGGGPKPPPPAAAPAPQPVRVQGFQDDSEKPDHNRKSQFLGDSGDGFEWDTQGEGAKFWRRFSMAQKNAHSEKLEQGSKEWFATVAADQKKLIIMSVIGVTTLIGAVIAIVIWRTVLVHHNNNDDIPKSEYKGNFGGDNYMAQAVLSSPVTPSSTPLASSSSLSSTQAASTLSSSHHHHHRVRSAIPTPASAHPNYDVVSRDQRMNRRDQQQHHHPLLYLEQRSSVASTHHKRRSVPFGKSHHSGSKSLDELD